MQDGPPWTVEIEDNASGVSAALKTRRGRRLDACVAREHVTDFFADRSSSHILAAWSLYPLPLYFAVRDR